MEAKKISFGFSKVAKKPNILPSKQPKEEPTVELIKCLEGKEIKLVAEKAEAAPLVIQMLGSQKTSSALASLMKRRAVLLGEEEPEAEAEGEESAAQTIAEVTGGDNLEERAAKELLAAAQNNGSEGLDGQKLVLPALKADELPLDGAKEATLDDYDAVPIQQFGLAMLRGMGWVDPPPKKKGAAPVDEAPFLRPKGMGLGADKALKPKALLVQPEKNEVLEIKKQAFVRILGGKQKDQYGQIEGFDDHAGRVIVKMAIGGTKEAFNEFLCQPVSRKEFAQYGKCINSAKYDEYKKQENEHGQIIVKQEKSSSRESSSRRDEDRDRKTYKTEESRSHRDEDRRRYKEEEGRSYKEEDRKTYKEEDRKSYKEEDRKSHREEDRKPYRDSERKPYKEEDRKAYKAEPRSERAYKEEGKSLKVEDRERNRQETRTSSSSTSRREDRSDRRRSPSPKSSSGRRPQSSSSDEAEDTGESTESDSDSAYERRKHKKSSSRRSRKHSKKSKGKSRRAARDSSVESDESSLEDSHRRHPSKHKKKTKKSKHARSRTRSRSRGRGRDRER
ncbi:hypothetical protein KR018_007381 [Drosophila ironensis]|nr:hypothetical protein KR018_007381 [Drosophila ironensis]